MGEWASGGQAGAQGSEVGFLGLLSPKTRNLLPMVLGFHERGGKAPVSSCVFPRWC